MTDVAPLPLWPHDLAPSRLDLIKRAKAELGLPFKIMPVPAVPGSPGRVLAFGSVPPFCCETVLVGAENLDNYDSVLGALRFALTAPAGTEGSFTEADWLSAVMGCEVIFSHEESLTSGPVYSGPVSY